MHPKTEIRPDRDAIKRVLDSGWCGQLKIHGHRVQFHVPPAPDEAIIAFNRHGAEHRKAVSPTLDAELRRLFTPKTGWSVVDAEWLKATDRIYLFDLLKQEGRLLRDLTYPQRYEMLPRLYLSPHLETLPLYRTVEKCLEALADQDPQVEGLVFKSLTSTGFQDTSILRCRRRS